MSCSVNIISIEISNHGCIITLILGNCKKIHVEFDCKKSMPDASNDGIDLISVRLTQIDP